MLGLLPSLIINMASSRKKWAHHPFISHTGFFNSGVVIAPSISSLNGFYDSRLLFKNIASVLK